MLTELSALLDMLKAKGVTSYKGPCAGVTHDGQWISLKLAASLSEPSAPADDAKPPLIEEERCKCGCPLYQHTNDGCGRGCDAEKCGDK